MSQTPPPPPPAASAGGYPVTVEFDSTASVRRWSPFVNWLLALPHVFVIYVLTIIWFFVYVISFFSILFTRNIPDGLFGFQVMVLRYQWRVGSYVAFLRSKYPPFDFDTAPMDPGPDVARLSVVKPAKYHRFLPLIKWLLAIPHSFVLFFLAIALYVVYFIGFFAVLFTGHWPEGLRNFLVGVFRWSLRVSAYTGFLVDAYPPFSLS
jgi:hypothetical protein